MGGATSYGRAPRLLIAIAASLAFAIAAVSAASSLVWVRAWRIGTVYTEELFVGGVTPSSSVSASPLPPTGKCSENPCNFLLLGSDSRSGLTAEQQTQFGTDDQIGGSNRADTIMLVHTDPRTGGSVIVSFPRDLWVEIPGHGADRINAAFEGGLERGGPGLMAQTVANLTGLRIDHFLYVDLAGFQRVVDTLGGVQMCVPAYDVNTPGWLTQSTATGERQVYDSRVGRVVDLNTGLDVKAGCQRMDGVTALAFVRTRHLPCDTIPDFARIGRQQQFLRALINQMLRPSQLARAPGLVEPVLANLKRDESFLPGDLIYLVGQMRGLSTGATEFRAVPGVEGTVGSRSVVLMDPRAQEIFSAIRQGQPLPEVGTELGNTPISPANVNVAVIDAQSLGKATVVQILLANAGFDVDPGIWPGWRTPKGIRGLTLVYRPGAEREASVVHAYLPGVRVVESAKLEGVPVAVVVDPTFQPQVVGPPGGAGCPAV